MDDDPGDLEAEVQEEVEDYLADAYPGLNADDRPRARGCLWLLALPPLAALWFGR